MILEFTLTFIMGITVILSLSIIYFLLFFENIFIERVYEKSYKAFVILMGAVILHGFYHASNILGYGYLVIFFELLSVLMFLTGVILLTRNALESHVSISVTNRLREELDKRTAELRKRTHELEESNRLKSLFIDILSHDLLNPIGAIKNASEMLLEEKEDETVEYIKKEASKLIELIKNTNTLARLESIVNLKLVDLDMGLMLKNVVKKLKPMAMEKNIRIDYYDGKDLPTKVNPLIEEVFANILSNAIKYSPRDSKVVIDVEDGGDYWRVKIIDRGIGIADEYKEKVFDRHKRINKEGVKGSGLGLAISKKIIDLHGGEIWVEDNPKGGSIFYIEIPKSAAAKKILATPHAST
jgi:signal transduction histidine kinase